MNKIEIKKGIYWVGAVDWNVRSFHGHTYNTQHGTTYNAYLIIDDKIALVDTVYGPFSSQLIERIKEIVDPSKIDCIVVNHVETDHSGALPEIMKLCPKAKIYGTAKCKEGLYRHYYLDLNFCVVKSGDKLKLGKKTINFIEAPMLHWPDSMFSYIPEEELLLPNDAFGQHLATSGRFDDEVDECVLMNEAKKYYANILWPLSSIVLKKIEEVVKSGISIKMIAPSHGIIWRKDPLKIINAYASWAKNETRTKVVIVYETMWGATEKIAKKAAEAIIDKGIEVKIFDIAVSGHTEVIGEMLDSRAYLFGSSTHDNNMLPNMASFLELLKGLKPKNRLAAVFGSFGWAGGAVKEIEEIAKTAGMTIAQDSLGIQYAPSSEDIKTCYSWGLEFAKKV